ncbi:MAG: hypothetical protein IJU62_04740 [Muribaculaceae bacterium]|nr:hypothetical protein [Muribaculaceae bacterium]
MSTVSLNFTTSGADVTSQLTGTLASLGNADTIIVHFGAGTFHISNAVVFQCNTIIYGEGADVTKVVCDSGASFTANDTYLTFKGSKNGEISVDISNLEVCISEHTGILWSGNERHLMKIVHSNDVHIHGIRSYCYNAAITNLDMRVCSNVTIKDCEFINYNNCLTGGVIWMRRDTHNVAITHNRLVKYGNDEIIAFWEAGDDNTAAPISGIKENIIIADNEITYARPSFGDTSIRCTIFITFYNVTNTSSQHYVPTEFKNIHFTNNDIKIDSPMTGLISYTFNAIDTHQNITFRNNRVLSTANNVGTNSSYQVICVRDTSGSTDAIQIVGNNFSTLAITTDQFNDSATIFLNMYNGRAVVVDNTYVSPYYIENNKRRGTALFWPHGDSNHLQLYNNHFVGLKNIGVFSSGSGLVATIIADGNLFSGDTRTYCNNCDRADLKFNNNTFISESYETLLQEFASTGTLLFTNNNVDIQFINSHGHHEGVLIAHYSSDPLSSMYFERFEVTGNVVQGTTAAIWILSGLNCGIYIVNNNSFYNS